MSCRSTKFMQITHMYIQIPKCVDAYNACANIENNDATLDASEF